MNDRYFAKVVRVIDDYSVVLNKGQGEINVGMEFIIVGLGDIITDPDTGEEIEQLEIVRGRVKVDHVQDRISTALASQVESNPGRREVKKVFSKGANALAAFIGPQETVTESYIPEAEVVKPLKGVAVGDFAIRASRR